MSAPQLIPSFLFTGEQQYVVVEFQNDIPPGISIITLTFHGQHKFHRIPVTKIGPKTIKALFPAFSVSGVYTIVPKFDHEERPAKFPSFDIKILSPLESLKLCLLPSSENSVANCTRSVAAILAYLIQTEANNIQVNMDLVDDILSSALKKMDIPFSDLSTFLAGNYSTDNLLHFSLSHRLPWTGEYLSNLTVFPDNETPLSHQKVIPESIASQWFQSPNHIDGLKPAEIARNVGFHQIAEKIEEQVLRCPLQPPTEEKSGSSAKSKIQNFKKVIKKAGEIKDTASKAAGVINYAVEKGGKAGDLGQSIQDKSSGLTGSVDINSVKNAVGEVKQGINVANDVKDISKKVLGVGKYMKKLKKKKSKSSINEDENTPTLKPGGNSGVQLAQNFIHELKDSALYSGQLSSSYSYTSPSAGYISLKAGETVHVIREEANGMCKGIVQERYCDLPKRIIQSFEDDISEEEDDDDDSHCSDDYEEIQPEYEEVQYNHDITLGHSGIRTPLVKRANTLREQKIRSRSIESGLNRVGLLPVLPQSKPLVTSRAMKGLPHNIVPQSPYGMMQSPIPRAIAPQSLHDKTPQSPCDIAPQSPRDDIAPQSLRDIAPQSPRDIAPQSPRDIAPQSPHNKQDFKNQVIHKPVRLDDSPAAPPLPPKQHNTMPSSLSSRPHHEHNRPLPAVPTTMEQQSISHNNDRPLPAVPTTMEQPPIETDNRQPKITQSNRPLPAVPDKGQQPIENNSQPIIEQGNTRPLPSIPRTTEQRPMQQSSPSFNRRQPQQSVSPRPEQEHHKQSYFETIHHQTPSVVETVNNLASGSPALPIKPRKPQNSPLINRKIKPQGELDHDTTTSSGHSPPPLLPPKPPGSNATGDHSKEKQPSQSQQWSPPIKEKPIKTPRSPQDKESPSPLFARKTEQPAATTHQGISNSPSLELKKAQQTPPTIKKQPPPPPVRCGSTLSETQPPIKSPRLPPAKAPMVPPAKAPMVPPAKATMVPPAKVPIQPDDIDDEYDDLAKFRKIDEEQIKKLQSDVKSLKSMFEKTQF